MEELLLSPKAATADPLPKHHVWLVEFSCTTVTKSLKETVADPTCAQSIIATRYEMCCSGQHGVHGVHRYNHHQQQDVACADMCSEL